MWFLFRTEHIDKGNHKPQLQRYKKNTQTQNATIQVFKTVCFFTSSHPQVSGAKNRIKNVQNRYLQFNDSQVVGSALVGHEPCNVMTGGESGNIHGPQLCTCLELHFRHNSS